MDRYVVDIVGISCDEMIQLCRFYLNSGTYEGGTTCGF